MRSPTCGRNPSAHPEDTLHLLQPATDVFAATLSRRGVAHRLVASGSHPLHQRTLSDFADVQYDQNTFNLFLSCSKRAGVIPVHVVFHLIPARTRSTALHGLRRSSNRAPTWQASPRAYHVFLLECIDIDLLCNGDFCRGSENSQL